MDWENVKPGKLVYRKDGEYKKGRLHKLIRENGKIVRAQVCFWHNDDPAKGQNRTVKIDQIYFKVKSVQVN
jgi:hypothetical protein